MADENISEKSRGTALALALTLGVFGGHRYYVGKVGTGLLMLCTLGGAGLWWLYDVIVVAAGGFRDANHKRVVSWFEGDVAPARPSDDRKQDLILQELDMVRGELADLHERVDFMERMLTQVKARGALPSREA